MVNAVSSVAPVNVLTLLSVGASFTAASVIVLVVLADCAPSLTVVVKVRDEVLLATPR